MAMFGEEVQGFNRRGHPFGFAQGRLRVTGETDLVRWFELLPDPAKNLVKPPESSKFAEKNKSRNHVSLTPFNLVAWKRHLSAVQPERPSEGNSA